DEEGRILSEILTEPLTPYLQGVTRLGIVPHRQLHLLPFAAMRTGGAYLIDRTALFFSPSASALQYTFARRRDTVSNEVLAIGNPDLGSRTLDLPFAQKE